MGNRLKRMLEEDNSVNLSVKFKSMKDRDVFAKVVEEIEETGVSKDVPIPLSIEISKKNGEYIYPVRKEENFVDFRVFPGEEIIDVHIQIDGKEETYLFKRRVSNDVIYISSEKSDVVNVEIDITKDDNKMHFSYTVSPINAKTVDELIYEYKRLLALLDTVFKNKDLDNKIEDAKLGFSYVINYYSMSKELASVLNIELTPKKLIKEDNSGYLIEKFYLLLVRKRIIRIDEKFDNVTVDDAQDFRIGQQLFATCIQEGDLEMFGVSRSIYVVNCFFGARIKDINVNDGQKIVFFEDSEKSPRYISCSAFLNREEAKNEIDRINENKERMEEYLNAIHWREQVKG